MATFPYEFIVIHDFGSYRRGDRITDSDECERVAASENAGSVHRVVRQPLADESPSAPAIHDPTQD